MRRRVVALAAEQEAGPLAYSTRPPAGCQRTEQGNRVVPEANALRRRRVDACPFQFERSALEGQHFGEVDRAKLSLLEKCTELERLGQEREAGLRMRLPEPRHLARQA